MLAYSTLGSDGAIANSMRPTADRLAASGPQGPSIRVQLPPALVDRYTPFDADPGWVPKACRPMAAYWREKFVGSTSSAVARPASVRVQFSPPSMDLCTPIGAADGTAPIALKFSRPASPLPEAASTVSASPGSTRSRRTVVRVK